MNVAIERCPDYAHAREAVHSCLAKLGGMKAFVNRGQKVLLKPNLITGKPAEQAVNTHPAIIDAIVHEVREAGGIPTVGDSPGFQTAEQALEQSGIADVCRGLSVPMISLDSPETMNGTHIKSLQISGRLKEFDVIINLPKLKTHMLTGLTGAVKNCFGCVPGKTKSLYHMRFQDPVVFGAMLLDVYSLVHPRLSIMDAVVGMEGQGPGSGDPRTIGVILASTDAVALDTVVCEIVNLKDCATQVAAERQGHPSASLENITIHGPALDELRIANFKQAHSFMKRVPRSLQELGRRLLISRPVCIPEQCIGCERCKGVCPAAAITMVDKLPSFDYARCIRCYCCHEICPQAAIKAKEGIVSKAVNRALR